MVLENNVLQDFFVAQHDYPTAGSGRTLLVRRDHLTPHVFNTANLQNNYSTSNAGSWLDQTYVLTLQQNLQPHISAVGITSVVGHSHPTLPPWTNLLLQRRAFLLSATEFGLSDSAVGIEGSAVPIAAQLRPVGNSANSRQWTRSSFLGAPANTRAATVQANGTLFGAPVTQTAGLRPAFTLPSAIAVMPSGEIVPNPAPTINYSGDINLGNVFAPRNVGYTVTGVAGDTVTVTERLDGAITRRYAVTLGVTQSFQALGDPLEFMTILNGERTLTIEATTNNTVGAQDATPVNITFTKIVHSGWISLSNALPADDRPEVIRLSIIGQLIDAELSVFVCNNGNDALPTWENATDAVVSGINYIFSNTTKTATNWGVNVSVDFGRGASNTPGYIQSIQGAFG